MTTRYHLGWDNWFLVIPAAILGLVSLWTIHRMYQAGDIRRSIEVVAHYRVDGRPTLEEYVAAREGPLDCAAELISRFYGTLDVTCTPGNTGTAYRWRVHVGQRAFAPVDERTRALMREYAPQIFRDEQGTGGGRNDG